ncbi:MAG: cation transporter [Erysipelotrichaceae bacterium]|nr:cation transporter [Erysipelotrichaceae bacterium]
MEKAKEEALRSRTIIRTSLIGIGANVFLSALKAIVGLLSHSIAIVLDAVNNISDAASSLITIIGTRLASRQADRKHPFGYGRIEYLSALVISMIILYAGITSFVESVKKIIHPDQPDYSTVTLIIVASGVLVKMLLGNYVKKTGQAVNSDSLINSGEDARMDALISATTLVAAVIYLTAGISLEAWLGVVISILIIKSGSEMIMNTVSHLLGEPADVSLAIALKKTVAQFPQVSGVYDLVLHDYGPDSYNGSLHVEVADSLTASEIDDLIRKITAVVYEKHSVILTAISIYSLNSKDKEAVKIRDQVKKIVMSHEHVKQMHGFYLNRKDRVMRFDVVVSFDAGDRHAVFTDVLNAVKEAFPDHDVSANLDLDLNEVDMK